MSYLKVACCAACVMILVQEAPCETTIRTENVILVTLDGLRWQELFSGADQRLINSESGGVRRESELRERFWSDSAEERRRLLLPFFWDVVARQGQVWGDPDANCPVRVTNVRYFSYPGYNEILSGFADPEIDSNDKIPNRNTTVLEWLHRQQGFSRKVACFASWDVFPYIVNAERSRIYVNAGWQPLDVGETALQVQQVNKLSRELPHYWHNVRYDAFTSQGALTYLKLKQPRLLYVALGETDDWAHDGRYDFYLDSARRSDDFLRELWETLQGMPQYAGKTSLVVTTDHGRGHTRTGWKSHGTSIPGSDLIWVAVLGPDTEALGVRSDVEATQAQVAATVAALLGFDFQKHDSRVAAPLEVIKNP